MPLWFAPVGLLVFVAPEVPLPRFAVPLVAVAGGEPAKFLVRGGRLDKVTAVSVEPAGVTAKFVAARKAPGPKTVGPVEAGDTEVELLLTVPPSVSAEAVTLTFLTGKKRSLPLSVPVERGPVTLDKERNDELASPQAVKLPAVVLGTIGGDRDVDVFQFEAKAGQVVRVEAFAARLGAPTDLNLVVFDADRRVLALVDDSPATVDPACTFTAPRDGRYWVSLAESHDRGGALFGYRLVVK